MLGRYRSPKYSKITAASESSHYPCPYPGPVSALQLHLIALCAAFECCLLASVAPESALCRSLNHMKSKMRQWVLYDHAFGILWCCLTFPFCQFLGMLTELSRSRFLEKSTKTLSNFHARKICHAGTSLCQC